MHHILSVLVIVMVNIAVTKTVKLSPRSRVRFWIWESQDPRVTH